MNDPKYPIIICQFSSLTDNKGCKIDKPFRDVLLYNYIDQEYPITFNNLFVNSGAMMSLISCKIVLNGNSENRATYKCSLIEANDYSYYITSESKTFIENDIKPSLIECTKIVNEYISCKEFEKEKLGSSYYINSNNNSKIINCNEDGCMTKIGINYYMGGCSKTISDINNDIKVNCDESVSELIDCSGSKCKNIIGNNREIYIKGDGEGLIRCKNDICEEIEGNKNGAYINGSKDKNIKPIIVYKDNKWISQTAITNTLYLNGNRDKNENGKCKYSFIYCTTNTECFEISGESGKKYIDITSTVIFTCNTEDEGEKLKSKNIIEDLSSENNIKGFIVNPSKMEILNYDNNSEILVVCTYDGGSKAICSIKLK